jgi:hypothetical protein
MAQGPVGVAVGLEVPAEALVLRALFVALEADLHQIDKHAVSRVIQP